LGTIIHETLKVLYLYLNLFESAILNCFKQILSSKTVKLVYKRARNKKRPKFIGVEVNKRNVLILKVELESIKTAMIKLLL
jgi:hypothetical protein